MKRLYYLTDNIDSVESISEELHRKGITEWNFHVMSHDKYDLKQHHLHTTNTFLHERDGIRIAERGALIGIVAGIFATIGFIMFTPLLEVRLLAAALLIAVCLLMGTFGAVLGAIFGSAFENSKIAQFHDDLASGKFLIMADVTKDNIEQVKNVMQVLHAEAIAAGEDETVITPFKVVTPFKIAA